MLVAQAKETIICVLSAIITFICNDYYWFEIFHLGSVLLCFLRKSLAHMKK